ncbi:MAG TPA: UDP-3-O-acyl-N-acetylglucosamine deacetylase [Candidatus Sumerlaeota bacterium]|nr:UDP-3-O-acyl-N-acetylglucosamine deacetylase [Candidatus Sumerlaeota bacterium]
MTGFAPRQQTLAGPVETRGIALHHGVDVAVRLVPAPPDHGIVFERVDLPGRPRIAVSPESVDAGGLQRRTELAGSGAARVATPEHLLAACAGLGVDNLLVELGGPELPIFDGSAAPWVELIDRAGLAEQAAPRRCFRLRRAVTLMEGDADLVALPAERPHFTFFATLRHAGLPNQAAVFDPDRDDFRRALAPARTFCFYDEVRHLMDNGLIKGGSLDCALVLRDGAPINAQYRLPNELAAHKLLDLIGDFAILGRPVAAHVSARGSGHALHYAFIRKLQEELIA